MLVFDFFLFYQQILKFTEVQQRFQVAQHLHSNL